MKTSGKNTFPAIGALIAAVLASTCCIGPFLAVAGFLGVSVSQLVWLASIKNYLIIISLVAISYSLYKAYKKPKQMNTNNCCQPTSLAEENKGKKSFSSVIRSKTFLWIVAIFTLLTLLAPYISNAQKATVKEVATTYKIEKLTQACCIGIIEYSLKDVKGYKKLKADLKKKEVVVWYDPKETDKAKIKEAIDKSTYTAEIKE